MVLAEINFLHYLEIRDKKKKMVKVVKEEFDIQMHQRKYLSMKQIDKYTKVNNVLGLDCIEYIHSSFYRQNTFEIV